MITTLGIDLARRSFVAALWSESHRPVQAQFDNHTGGFRQLRRWLQTHGVGRLRVGLESTNTYGQALAQWLHDDGHEVYLLNPERTAHYARALGQRNKTDPVDACTIAQFIARHEATRWWPLPPAQQHLRALTRTRQQLVATHRQLANQLATAEPAARPHLEAVLTALQTQLKAIEQEIVQHLRTHEELGVQARRLKTVKGVGPLTAAIVLAELPPITAESDPRALCAWAGLTPRRRQSGETELPAHLSRKGNAYLRDALYMPALVAKRFNPLLRDFASRLAAKGKRNPAILGAVAHKLLRILIALLRSGRDFDPNWAGTLS